MTNEQATELLALMADQIKATDRLSETFEKRFTQLNETMLNGFVRMEDKFDALTGRVDHLTEEVREVKEDIRDIKAEAQVTNRRLSATFDQTGRLTEENTSQQTRLRQLEAEEPTNAELHRRVLALEEQMRRAS
ncbi:MAG TPA: hypothetical protein VFO93_09795 [Hymenobacter sp.]|uniref:hypothetical protein n=1 Tax=Hymenobacter sp. TaxID=1898978 RepID=UPI002D7F5165|nr:hypothetical protein [Hymenobacter sp.]HET9503824.1 hypothetical protein [Hymenobacter sp.]